jgi:hypothetical protein
MRCSDGGTRVGGRDRVHDVQEQQACVGGSSPSGCPRQDDFGCFGSVEAHDDRIDRGVDVSVAARADEHDGVG